MEPRRETANSSVGADVVDSARLQRSGGVRVVTLKGSLDSSSALNVKDKIRNVLRAESRRVVVDASQLTAVDLTGFSALVVAQKAAWELGGEVALLRPSQSLRALLELPRFNDLFRIFRDEREAAILMSP